MQRLLEWLEDNVSPKQYCGYCGMPYWTWHPWNSWRCNHPNCQADLQVDERNFNDDES